MKKKTLSLLLITPLFCALAFAYSNWQTDESSRSSELSCASYIDHGNPFKEVISPGIGSDFYLQIDNRWETITKEQLLQAKSIPDLFESPDYGVRKDFSNSRIYLMEHDRPVYPGVYVLNEVFNDEQHRFLESLEYSTNILFTGINQQLNPETGEFQADSMIRYVTIVPELQAEYERGNDELVRELRRTIETEMWSFGNAEKQPGKYRFVVTENGTIGTIVLESTSGSSWIDEKMISLIQSIRGSWIPAEDAEGNKVSQEFYLFFPIVGC